MSWKFHKFPRTPHVPGSGGDLRAEKILGADQVQRLLEESVLVEEKMDGANLGISFDGRQPRFQNRGNLIESGRTHPQFQPIYSWFAQRQQALLSALGERYLLFGEWLFARHTVAYDALPDYFLAFDVWDREEEAFVAVAKRNQLCGQMGVPVVPLLFEGKLASMDALEGFFDRSCCGVEPAEGLYIRLEKDGFLELRAKFVRAGWVPPDEVHWAKRSLESNHLAQVTI